MLLPLGSLPFVIRLCSARSCRSPILQSGHLNDRLTLIPAGQPTLATRPKQTFAQSSCFGGNTPVSGRSNVNRIEQMILYSVVTDQLFLIQSNKFIEPNPCSSLQNYAIGFSVRAKIDLKKPHWRRDDHATTLLDASNSGCRRFWIGWMLRDADTCPR